MSRILIALALCSLLIACSSPDDAQTEEELASKAIEEAAEDEAAVAERAARREMAMERSSEEVEAIVERRDRLREQTQEQEQQDEHTEQDRPFIRQRSTEAWWRDPGVHEGLGLSEQQELALEDAATTALRERENLHRQMLDVRRELAQALSEEDEVMANDARMRRDEIQRQLEDVDYEWQDSLRMLLDQEQLEQLERQQPQWGRMGGR
jgi:hypothetical protein